MIETSKVVHTDLPAADRPAGDVQPLSERGLNHPKRLSSFGDGKRHVLICQFFGLL